MSALPTWLRALVVIAAAVVVAALIGLFFPSLRLVDLEVYSQAGNAVLQGNSLYGQQTADLGLAFTYPPFAAVVFVPLGWLGTGSAALAWSVVSVAALLRAIYLCLRAVGFLPPSDLRQSRRKIVVITGATLAFLALEPTLVTLAWGQINLVLMWLILEDFIGDARPRSRGLLIGLATAIKLAPAPFIVFAALVGRRREAVRAMVVFVVSVLVGGLITAANGWTYWTTTLLNSNRIGDQSSSGNQSIPGAIARITNSAHSPLWSWVVALSVLFASLVIAQRLWLTHRELEALSVVGIATVLASPIGWTHHWVWFGPALIALSARAREQRSAAYVVAIAAVIAVSWLPRWGAGVYAQRVDAGPPWQYAQWLASDAFVALGLVMLVWWGWSANSVTRGPSRTTIAAG